MNRTSSWRLAALFALAGWQMISAQDYSAPVAHAAPPIHIIPIGSPLTFGGANSPDDYTANTTFGPTKVLVDNGALRIWQDQVQTGANGEWDIFHMQTTNGGPLANNVNAEWNVVMNYNLSAAASFDAVVQQWAVNGIPVSPITNGIGSICCAQTSNPILPGPSYYNEGFDAPLPAGTQTNWKQIFVRPYTFVTAGGVNPNTANEFTFALHFTLAPTLPTVSGVISASAFGGFPTFAPGSWIEIYGTNFAVGTQTWASSDFNGVNAPTTLRKTSVTIGGLAAFVDFISPLQMNAQVPAGLSQGSQPLVVSTAAGSSSPFTVTVDAVQPGLLAPPSFKLGGTQNLVALFSDGATYVLPPGAISGLPSRRAKPGDMITLYGVGFGSVNPSIPPGQIAGPLNTLSAPFTISIGGKQAIVSYNGLAPTYVGLYQFNVIVPDIPASDTAPVTFSLNGVNGTQTFSIAVGN